MLIELDLEKREPRHGRTFGDARCKLEKVRRDECLRRELGEQRDHELEDFFALRRIRARAELVEDDHRSYAKLLEQRADAYELDAEAALGLVGFGFFDERDVETGSDGEPSFARGREKSRLAQHLRDGERLEQSRLAAGIRTRDDDGHVVTRRRQVARN